MKKKITSTRTLTVTITDFSDDSQDMSYSSSLRSLEMVGVCEHLRVRAMSAMEEHLHRVEPFKPESNG